jgi:hypothetical protein
MSLNSTRDAKEDTCTSEYAETACSTIDESQFVSRPRKTILKYLQSHIELNEAERYIDFE